MSYVRELTLSLLKKLIVDCALIYLLGLTLPDC